MSLRIAKHPHNTLEPVEHYTRLTQQCDVLHANDRESPTLQKVRARRIQLLHRLAHVRRAIELDDEIQFFAETVEYVRFGQSEARLQLTR